MKKVILLTLLTTLFLFLLPPPAFATSSTYTDVESGVSFTIPANWEQEAFTKDREFIDAKFVSTKEDGCVIIYGSTDMWRQMSASDRIGYTRSDINNSMFSKADIAEMYGTTANNISMASYSGIQYFYGEVKQSTNVSGISISVTMTQLVYFNNGWMYMFQFGGTDTHKLYSDFEDLLNSVKYLTADVSGDGFGIIAVIILLLIVFLIIFVLIYRKKKNQQNIAFSSCSNNQTVIPNSQHNAEPICICHNCGQPLPLHSKFCHVCGTRVINEDNNHNEGSAINAEKK